MSKKQTIDCTPTWSGLLEWLLAVVTDARTTEGRHTAKKELVNMAQTADMFNKLLKDYNEEMSLLITLFEDLDVKLSKYHIEITQTREYTLLNNFIEQRKKEQSQ